jgi:hypothetical protein
MIIIIIIKREFILEKHGSAVQNFKILKFFILTNYSLGMSNPTIKYIRQILLTAVTLLETHCFLPIKILIF